MELEQKILTKPENPVLFIIGSTASGKTKLSLELGKHFKNIEIVNADALQLYKGADIMTAKATKEERELVPHHILDILPLDKLDFERKEYFNIASKELAELHQQGKIPLVVGGTNYYIESLLYNDYDLNQEIGEDISEINEMHENVTKGIEENKENNKEPYLEKYLEAKDQEEARPKLPENWRDLSSKEKHNLLAKVDPLIAEKVHPNDSKRVENYLKVYIEEDVIPSKKIMKLDSQRKLRYQNAIIFWVKDQDKNNLIKRIEKRVHEMVNMDGLKEIVRIFEYFDKLGFFNFQKGVLQSIGYKEFHDFYSKLKDYCQKQGVAENLSSYLGSFQKIEDLAEELRNSIEDCKKKLISATEYYAKKQLTWIKNRMANQPILQKRTFLLEFTEVAKFDEQVVKKGIEIAQDFLEGKLELSNEGGGESHQTQLIDKYQGWKRHYCDVCEINLSGENEWDIHIKSKRHKKTKEGIAKYKRNMEMKAYHENLKSQQAQENPIAE